MQYIKSFSSNRLRGCHLDGTARAWDERRPAGPSKEAAGDRAAGMWPRRNSKSTNRLSGDIPMRNLTLDLNALAVESFEVAGDPTQWLVGPPPTEGCDTNLAPPAETHERICTTV
jgi:hypothetical protein